MGLIFITHNLAVVAEIADRVCVLYAGEIVEQGPVGAVFAAPHHPYTAALLASVPEETTPDETTTDGTMTELAAIPGVVPPPYDLPPGCRFAPRCSHAAALCETVVPALQSSGPHRATRCLRWRELA
jgi:peptide/nickel transport system permease protein